MNAPTLPSRHASPGRLPVETVRAQAARLLAIESATFVNAIPHVVMVLNSCRQLIFANEAFLRFLGLDGMEPVLGKRPGEILDCVHVDQETGGCGTTEFCTQCGAVKAILSSLEGVRSVQECHLLRRSGPAIHALDLQVAASPFLLLGESCSVFSVVDISHEKRRRALERTFFHDILNTAGGIKGLIELLSGEAPPFLRNDANILHASVQHLIDEILAQREIMAAENGELNVRVQMVWASDVLDTIRSLYSNHEVTRGREIRLGMPAEDVSLRTDPRLLSRIVGNMVKNALEASRSGETVLIACDTDGAQAVFSVHNPGVVRPDVRLNIFKRSYSTKGEGRGLGTFSMRLFAEGYLGGHVDFESTPESGTTFFLRLPLGSGR